MLLLLTFMALLGHQVAIVDSAVIALDMNNLDGILKSGALVFVNFHADWCRFSQQLMPIFEQASDQFKDHSPSEVLWATVDCDRQPEIAQHFRVSKYPTLKLFRKGELTRKEYRGQRSVEALTAFIRQQLDAGLLDFGSLDELEARIDKQKRNVIAFFAQKQGADYENFKTAASALREDDLFKWKTAASGNSVAFRPRDTAVDELYTGNLGDLQQLNTWLTDRCVPVVREITFENAEELTEEGLPFVILFRDPAKDADIDRRFSELVARELHDQRSLVNVLLADGRLFSHPLRHMGKGVEDLPLLAIDTFRRMHLFPNISQMTVPGQLRQFIIDLHTGKLDREAQFGADPSPRPNQSKLPNAGGEQLASTSAPESVFKKLQPSENRYTLLKQHRDEL